MRSRTHSAAAHFRRTRGPCEHRGGGISGGGIAGGGIVGGIGGGGIGGGGIGGVGGIGVRDACDWL
eukprot:2177598-Lingulodinium_polyedra.AAC.1